ncbi:hypothetical protein [Ketogulonicigenium vulgare]|uniref:Cytochrome C oxidase assembly protein n=1 Tax=Ketogulonicigenium vulgare (strain WSH-001) TaxID=759362 RepID=F9Y9G6_KETVW|nr:hypothetical protein [Ketogulonicigenium vulgare]ADO41924.1 conserved hypothetical protein [Ketogulonicigenium vulgare Y25]AEM40148.1 cytochrome C oxidase assembly protein [Ketogulonicigenium vulgare WSH-001]ALJ80353.1 cytochrome C oxidase assembly protein [Ketogulonicigenium vulgare]ANW34912.1 hypothetical protein KvSKV_03635 [Ketogulonicigenium vulgare]AOZ53847.1 Methyl-accepting chemotaxis protein [Ketogulonicigenium vulgare]
MAIRVEHELHQRRKGRNYGLLAVLIGFVAIVFGLTVVKVTSLDDISQFEAFDHVARPQLVPGQIDGGTQ